MRVLPMLLAAGLGLWAQEKMPARPGPGDYPARAATGDCTLAAEFLGRTVPAPNGGFLTPKYVVIEVAVYGKAFGFNTGHFTLRLNGKQALLAQTPGLVAGGLRYSDWEGERGLTAEAGLGNAGVVLGRTRSVEPRFPGDNRVPRAPSGTPGKVVDESPTTAWDWVGKLAWDDGEIRGPAAGLLYFPYAGNLAKLKTVVLEYNGPTGAATLVLRGTAGPPAKSAGPGRRP